MKAFLAMNGIEFSQIFSQFPLDLFFRHCILVVNIAFSEQNLTELWPFDLSYFGGIVMQVGLLIGRLCNKILNKFSRCFLDFYAQ